MSTPLLDRLAVALLPPHVRRTLRAQQRRFGLQQTRVGTVNWGDLRRRKPISPTFGFDRGMAIDRFYIEQFLERNNADIRGRVLEMGDDFYTKKFGGERVTGRDVMHSVAGNPLATIVGDLTRADHIPSDTFDCIIFTQTLQMIFDPRAAVATLHRILKPGSILLVTVPGITKIARREGLDPWGEYWHFTTQSANRLFSEFFPPAQLQINTSGNITSAIAMLHGLAAEELAPDELEHCDPDYEVIISVRAER